MLATVLDPDLVLLDWNLPDMSGEKILSALQEICHKLPVIVLSGQLEIKKHILELGASAFISKTSPPDQLVKTIQSVMNFKTEGVER